MTIFKNNTNALGTAHNYATNETHLAKQLADQYQSVADQAIEVVGLARQMHIKLSYFNFSFK
jgi:hypothetical protein